MGNYPFISMPLVLWKRNQGIGQYFAYIFGLSNGAKEHVIWFVSVVRGGGGLMSFRVLVLPVGFFSGKGELHLPRKLQRCCFPHILG